MAAGTTVTVLWQWSRWWPGHWYACGRGSVLELHGQELVGCGSATKTDTAIVARIDGAAAMSDSRMSFAGKLDLKGSARWARSTARFARSLRNQFLGRALLVNLRESRSIRVYCLR